MAKAVKTTQRRRELGSLSLSIGIHLGVLLAGSLVWVAAQLPSSPEPVEVEFLRLPPPPAPTEGQPALAEAGQASDTAQNTSAAAQSQSRDLLQGGPGEVRQAGRRAGQVDSPRKLTKGPSIQARVTVAKAGFDAKDHSPGSPALIANWQPAAPLAIDRTRHDRHSPRRAARQAALRGRSFAVAGFGSGALGDAETQRPAQQDPDDLPFHVHDHGAGSLSRLLPALEKPEAVGGDRRALVDNIQTRIDRVAPLVHRTSQGCRNASGLARIRFVMDKNGYPIGYQILSSAGNPCLDTQIDTVLHLAEPYPFVAGWVPVKVKFTL